MKKVFGHVNLHIRFLEIIFKVGMIFCSFTAKAYALPDNGPTAQANKKILFVASNLRNGGVRAVSDSFQRAAHELKWQVLLVDCAGKKSCVQASLKSTLSKATDGIVLGGFDGADFREILKKAQKRGMKVVGWHASAKAGVTEDMFVNISTDPVDVAKTAAHQLEKFGRKPGGVIILTDRDYSIATLKTLSMKKAVEAMPDFKLLAVEDVAISNSDKEIYHLVKSWNQRFGKAWTHTLAINDLYFDYMADALKGIQRNDVVGIGAGDGSIEAINRVGSSKTAQMVTVAEPLQTQGWQIADELNRAFAGEPPSGYATEPLVITKKLTDEVKDGDIEERIPYQSTYKAIWYPHRAKPKD
ncbi:substrate-binding domain-containing protein [Bdellovibrio sp. KM01]|uniref:substrate-binding domain-containing protein n=1 Tax=Bdellovibrio sp. KM01 TaxID=2748865 RepID=UPI0015E9394A|nr:substrate-binding domain-containing protein [Bdellovibrio sp. KM01]QLY26461.1 substrate-binding domain-containing protein [Bdellovibrio sp. KM01]